MSNFTKGQRAKLADLTSETVLEMGVQLTFGTPCTVDISCFGVDANGQLSDDRYLIFYNQKQSPCGSLQALGSQGSDNERFRVDLGRLPQSIRRLVFTATIDGAGTMAQLRQGTLELRASGRTVASFGFTGADFGQEKAILVGELYFKDVWRFAAIGQGFEGGMSALLKHFGGQEIHPAAPPSPTARPAPPPPEPPKVNLGKVTLDKKGDKKAVNLQKGGGVQPIHFNLNWNAVAPKRGLFGLGSSSADLDLGCMYRLRDGSAGVIQPLGGNLGAKDRSPYIYLDKDDRSGGAADGENLYILRPDLIDLVMVFGFIYEGARDFTEVGGRMTIRDHVGNEILVHLGSPDRNLTFCAICTVRKVGETVEVTKEERYFSGHLDADRHFGFGFNWRAGKK